MPLPGVSAALAVAFVLMPVFVGYAPARSQDFSITNTTEPADAGRRDLMRQLQAWWDVHAYYPKDASQSGQGGTLKVHLVIHPDGNIWMVDVVESSGSRSLDRAGALAFRGGFVRPLSAVPADPDTTIEISLHYVLAERTAMVAKSPFTISNEVVKSAVVDTMLQRTCSGTVVKNGLRNHPIYGSRYAATAVFFRKPDGTSWVKFWEGRLIVAPVSETGKLAQWTAGPEYLHGDKGATIRHTRYTVWPDGDNHLTGDIADPRGTVDFTCATEIVPAITSSVVLESPQPPWPQAEVRE